MKFLSDLTFARKRVLVRGDLNVPLNEKHEITDDNRIKELLPTIKHILAAEGKPIVMSHLGRPTGKGDPSASLKPVAEKMAALLGCEVVFAPDCIGAEVEKLVELMKPGQVLLLENLRFHNGEKDNDEKFAKQLARLGDVYVNDAFATAHRAEASIVALAKLFKERAAGLLMQKELDHFKQAMEKPKRPLCVILGGAKVSGKLQALLNVAQRADKLIIGGAMANTFLAAQGLQLGKSLVERELFGKAMEILAMMARREAKVYLPVDFVVGPSPTSKGLGRPVPAMEFPPDMMALDIGPATSILYRQALQTAETIVWNGPMGCFENEDYAKGTTDLIEGLASAHGLTVAGGGDTDAAIHQMQLAHRFDFISTGGGAFLALLEGNPLPGLQALE